MSERFGLRALRSALKQSTPAPSSMPEWYPELLTSVTRQVKPGRSKAIAAANQEMLVSYLAIGRDILDRQNP